MVANQRAIIVKIRQTIMVASRKGIIVTIRQAIMVTTRQAIIVISRRPITVTSQAIIVSSRQATIVKSREFESPSIHLLTKTHLRSSFQWLLSRCQKEGIVPLVITSEYSHSITGKYRWRSKNRGRAFTLTLTIQEKLLSVSTIKTPRRTENYTCVISSPLRLILESIILDERMMNWLFGELSPRDTHEAFLSFYYRNSGEQNITWSQVHSGCSESII